MKNRFRILIVAASLLFCFSGFSQTEPPLAYLADAIKFRIVSSNAIRDAYVVPTGQRWLIANNETSRLEWWDGDSWEAIGGGASFTTLAELNAILTDATLADESLLLPLDGSRAMTGALDMDGNDITNSREINGERLILNNTFFGTTTPIVLTESFSGVNYTGNYGSHNVELILSDGASSSRFLLGPVGTQLNGKWAISVDGNIVSDQKRAVEFDWAGSTEFTAPVTDPVATFFGKVEIQPGTETNQAVTVDQLNTAIAGVGGGSDGNDFVTGGSLSGTDLTLTIPNQTNPVIDLSGLGGGGSSSYTPNERLSLNGSSLADVSDSNIHNGAAKIINTITDASTVERNLINVNPTEIDRFSFDVLNAGGQFDITSTNGFVADGIGSNDIVRLDGIGSVDFEETGVNTGIFYVIAGGNVSFQTSAPPVVELYTVNNWLSRVPNESDSNTGLSAVGVTLSRETTLVGEGVSAVRIANTDGSSDRMEVTTSLAANTTYNISFYGAQDGSDLATLAWTGFTVSTPTWTPVLTGANTTMQEFTTTITTDSGSSQLMRWYANGGAGNAVIVGGLSITEQ